MTSPTTFGKYLLLERINIGGMAEVFKAKTFGIEGFERVLAVKRILPNMAEDEEFINMFIDEARIAVQLSHPNVVSIYELGKFESQYYIAMEYVPGKDLRQVLDRFRKGNTTMPTVAAAYLVSKICEGLDYAHRKADPSGRPLNLIHRDVSPQNILLSYEGAVKITDFGIVKAEDRASKTQAGVLKGKFGYMSPEQVRGLEIDRRSDIFAVGILLYEALTGKRLFIGESDFSTLEKVRNAEVVPPSEHNPEVTEALEKVVLKALARERDERYQWAIELHDDLQRFLIEGDTIFNAQRLGGLLRGEYQAEIEEEQQKMESFLRLPPPQTALSAAADMRSVPTGDWSDNRSEKTMIFESGFNASGIQTQLGESMGPSLANLPPSAAPTLNQSAQVLPAAVPAAKPKRKPVAPMVAAFGVFVALLGVLGYLLLDSGPASGTLVVTSTPVEVVDIFMDDQLIAQKTPLVRPNVPAGEHTLLARAKGFGDKAYRFDLVAGAPAEIKVELERSGAAGEGAAAAPGEVAGEPQVEITSEPAAAAVRLGGVPQGATPYTLSLHDAAHPITLEVAKTGFISQTLTITLAPGERRKAVHVKLVALDGPDLGAMPRGMTPGKLILHSRPDGCTIYLNGVDRGMTPRDIAELDPRQSYSLELVKEGYRPYKEQVNFGGRTAVAVSPTLVPEVVRRRAKAAPLPSLSCSGSAGKISVMPVGIADCKVTVGKMSLGVAPVFKKDCPTGRCAIDVRCQNGKRYQVTRTIHGGTEEKVIIKADDWR
jgi:serine/threonine protein kinase